MHFHCALVLLLFINKYFVYSSLLFNCGGLFIYHVQSDVGECEGLLIWQLKERC